MLNVLQYKQIKYKYVLIQFVDADPGFRKAARGPLKLDICEICENYKVTP